MINENPKKSKDNSKRKEEISQPKQFDIKKVGFYSEVENILRLSDTTLKAQLYSKPIAFSFVVDDENLEARRLIMRLLDEAGIIEISNRIYACSKEQYQTFAYNLKKHLELKDKTSHLK